MRRRRTRRSPNELGTIGVIAEGAWGSVRLLDQLIRNALKAAYADVAER
jgi:hypothetical protein